VDVRFVEKIRRVEIELVLAEMRSRKPPGSSIIEIGGGAGWQARALSAAGFNVRSFDLPESPFSNSRIFAIEEYDGRHIPAADSSFDMAFSSNVLEHISEVELFQAELHRVLKADAVVVHIVPSATWRAYTSLTHYAWLIKAGLGLMRSKFGQTSSNDAQVAARAAPRRSMLWLFLRVFWSPRHGEKGNALSELYRFSRFRWTRLFQQTGWDVLARYPNRLYYTGYGLLDDRLSIKTRKRLSQLLGSACHVYVLERGASN
jgi:SAM-dependent methyltransferase